jgi:hypothetical protein
MTTTAVLLPLRVSTYFKISIIQDFPAAEGPTNIKP